MSLYKQIRAAMSRRRKPPRITPTDEELKLLAHIRYCLPRGIAVVLEPYSRREIIDRMAMSAAKERQAIEGLTDFETIELTGYYPG